MKKTTTQYGLRSKIQIALVSTAICTASTGSAQDFNKLELNLSGEVEPRCELTDFNQSSADFSLENNARIDFNVYCNLEMSVSISSENGGLAHETRGNASSTNPMFIRRYEAKLSILGAEFEATMRSEDMQSGVTFELGDVVVFETSGSIEIELDESVAGGYAGVYSDQIRVTVAPSLATIN